jgi:hypothetical protein
VTYHVVKVNDAGLVGVLPWAVVVVRPTSSETSPNEVYVRVESYGRAKLIADHLNGVI